jgi:MarR family transcriptional regulator, repressor for mepA
LDFSQYFFQELIFRASNKTDGIDLRTRWILESMQKRKYLKLWVDLINTKRAISKVRQKELIPFKITPEQTGILFELTEANYDPTPADLSRKLLRDPSSITIMLNRMETSGLISKTIDPVNKNLIRVLITEKGRELYGKIVNRISVYRIFSGLDDKQCQELQTFLDILQSRASEELDKLYKRNDIRE